MELVKVESVDKFQGAEVMLRCQHIGMEMMMHHQLSGDKYNSRVCSLSQIFL